jgi:hypothetical protein
MRLNSTKRQGRSFWVPWVATSVLACFSNAVAQTSYTVTDLGHLSNWNLGCAMGLIVNLSEHSQ